MHRYPRPLPVILAVVLGLAGILAGCDADTLTSSADPDPIDLAPNVRMQLSFDQVEAVYSSQWPEEIAASKSSDATEYMVDYEATRETVTYDTLGYLNRTYVYTEGSPTMNMPEKDFLALQQDMPGSAIEADPIHRFELKNGTMSFYLRSGKLARSVPINPEDYQVDPGSFAEMKIDTANVSERRSAFLAQLRQDGISYRELDDARVAYSIEQKNDNSLGEVEETVDLRIGMPVQRVFRHKNGATAGVEHRVYTVVSDVPVMQYSSYEEYGDLDGAWSVVRRTVTERSNISLVLN